MSARNRQRPAQRRVFSLSLGVLLAGGIGATALLAAGSPSCGPWAEGEIRESQEFTPYEARLSHLPDAPVIPFGASIAEVPSDAMPPGGTIDGLALRWAVNTSAGEVYQYFLEDPMDSGMTYSEFVAAGGVVWERYQSDGFSYADHLLSELGARATEVQVGAFRAALTWADPERNGVRTHNLYWSDGVFSYALVAERMPAALVNLGREIACG